MTLSSLAAFSSILIDEYIQIPPPYLQDSFVLIVDGQIAQTCGDGKLRRRALLLEFPHVVLEDAGFDGQRPASRRLPPVLDPVDDAEVRRFSLLGAGRNGLRGRVGDFARGDDAARQTTAEQIELKRYSGKSTYLLH